VTIDENLYKKFSQEALFLWLGLNVSTEIVAASRSWLCEVHKFKIKKKKKKNEVTCDLWVSIVKHTPV